MLSNMDFNIATIIMFIIVFFYFYGQYDITAKSSRLFLNLLGSIGVTAFLDLSTALLISKTESFVLLNIVILLYLFFTVFCAFSFSEYSNELINPSGKPSLFDSFNRVLFCAYAISCVISLVPHFYVYIESDNLVRGNAYIVIYLLSAYYLLYSFYKIIRNFKKLNTQQTKGIILFVIITISGAVIQYFLLDEHIVVYFIYAISCLVLLFAFETPDYQRMVEVTEELRLNKDKLESSKKREEDLSKTVHQLMNSCSWGIDFDEYGNMKYAFWSDEIRPILGYSPEDEIDVNSIWTASLHPDDKDATMKAFTDGMFGKPYRTEARLRYKDGSYHWFLCTGNLETDDEGRIITYQGIIQNIDDEILKRQLVEERLKAISDLEKSKEELQKALFDAQEANMAKTTFLSNMSHDIRTPMNAIIGYTQLAKEHISNPGELTDCLNTIKASGDHLLSLINDVLDMSRIESGKVKTDASPCDLSEMIKEIEQLTKANVDERSQTYETVIENLTDPFVMCDRLRLNQVLINCVGNSVKYTPEGGHIKVSLSEQESDSDGTKVYVFKITDNGIGMSEEFLKHVFDPFERAQDSTSSQIQGTGLGMAITQNLVTMMGGTISAESELGKGSTFIITLPLTTISKDKYTSSRETKISDATMEQMLSALSGKKFLVVDDNKINRTIVKRLLSERGMFVDECDSGAKAIEIAGQMNSDSYDMIFMDIQMPGMSGYEASDAIRNLDNEICKTIPIIAMTANAFEEDKKNAQLHGMNGHVTKPFKINELIMFLYNILQ